MKTFRLGLAQLNALVGDIDGNLGKIEQLCERAERSDADLIAFPEMAITGYPPEDLLLKREFVEDNLEALDGLIAGSADWRAAAVVGFVDRDDRGRLFNAAAVLHGGRLVHKYHKILLPNYGVFDERRYFEPGCGAPIFFLDDVGIGVNICEDIWHRCGPSLAQASQGANMIVSINSSPYHVEKWRERLDAISLRARETSRFVAYVNLVGGQDELVFDGHSLVVDPMGEMIARGPAFEEELLLVDIDTEQLEAACGPPAQLEDAGEYDAEVFRVERGGRSPSEGRKGEIRQKEVKPLEGMAEIYAALVLGTRDYVRKSGFKEVVIGLSGGVDSAITAVIAVDALGSENVHVVMMPSPYTAPESREDAVRIAELLRLDYDELGITDIFSSYLETLAPSFKELGQDVTEENIQARIRGNLLMALSNKFGWLLLTTGNKSEMSVGYCTLYGDMSGGFAVLKDVVKTQVYELCRYRNGLAGGEVIPERVITRPPSAELREDQRDTDSLPPYEVLDPILQSYVERDESPDDIVSKGFDRDTVERVIRMVDRNEYKRRQAPPGIKITRRAFGKDRRMPITNAYSH